MNLDKEKEHNIMRYHALPYPSLHYPTLPYLTLPYHVNFDTLFQYFVLSLSFSVISSSRVTWIVLLLLEKIVLFLLTSGERFNVRLLPIIWKQALRLSTMTYRKLRHSSWWSWWSWKALWSNWARCPLQTLWSSGPSESFHKLYFTRFPRLTLSKK